jgi:hypothetical protein
MIHRKLDHAMLAKTGIVETSMLKIKLNTKFYNKQAKLSLL